MHSVVELPGCDSLSIPIDYPILSQYITLQPYVCDGKHYVAGVNHFTHSLDFINLSGGEHYSLTLDDQGPDAVLEGFRFCQVEDKFVCMDASGLLVMDTKGKVRQQMPVAQLLEPKGEYLIRPKGVSYGNFKTNLGHTGNEVFVPMFLAKKDGASKIGKVYDAAHNTLEELPMTYPEDIKNNTDALGALAYPQIVAYEDLILYSFPASSAFYLYERGNGDVKRMEMKSRSVPNTIDAEARKKMDFKDRFFFEMITHRFNEVHYCAETGCFYRIHYGAKESRKDKHRSMYLMVCDEDARNVREYLLPARFQEQYVVMDNQIYFFCKESDDSKLCLARIDVGKL